MNKQQLLSYMRRAINDYNMIQSGDKVAVGVSGGKDSMALLALLKAFQQFSDKPFELMGITIDMGFKGSDNLFAPVQKYCDDNNIHYVVEKTDIAEIVFDVRKETNPCSLCSKMRRGALNSVMARYGYNKLALGHHKNDIVDTFLLSLMHEGRLSTMQPKSYMSRADITLIRPLVYIAERDMASLYNTLPVIKSPCPADKHTQRESMKDIIALLRKQYPDIDERFARAIMHPERYNLWDNIETKYNEQKNTKH